MSDIPGQRPDIEAWHGLELLRVLEGGARNAVFLARRGTRDYVVRTSSRPIDSLQWEIELLSHLTACGISVPRLVTSDDGRHHVGGVMVHEFVPGERPRNRADWERVTQALRGVHEVTEGWSQRPGFRSSRVLLREERGGDVDLARMSASDVALVRDAWSRLPPATPCVIHGDLGAGNILVHGEKVTLIDWDESRVDVPWFDFVHVDKAGSPLPVDENTLRRAGLAWEVATCWTVEPEHARRVLEELKALPD